MKRNALIALTALLSLTCLSAPSLAQEKPVRLIVPFSAGGPIDVTARILAEGVRDALGPVIIENKPGAGGNIGSDLVAKAAPDGTTIGVATLASHAVNPWLYKNMPFNAATDFEPITLMVRVPNVLVINTDLAKQRNIATLADLIDYAKKNPGKLNYGSGGNGSGGHLAGEMFKREAGVDIVHVPYNGGAPAQLALLSGQIDFTFDNLATASPNIRSGKLTALAVTTAKRSSELPNVPTVKEAGLDNFEVDTWWGLVAPAGTPKDVIAKLNAAFTATMRDPAVQKRFAGLLIEASPTTPDAFGKLMRGELTRYEAIVRNAGARVD
ncbi:MAG TPA: tripartite tricarboxylate transporter substrate binding protein [Candidimonas sp.]|nr:tripartite tricarboxylate transporter substrate binding protein [Candidimonas sp.]